MLYHDQNVLMGQNQNQLLTQLKKMVDVRLWYQGSQININLSKLLCIKFSLRNKIMVYANLSLNELNVLFEQVVLSLTYAQRYLGANPINPLLTKGWGWTGPSSLKKLTARFCAYQIMIEHDLVNNVATISILAVKIIFQCCSSFNLLMSKLILCACQMSSLTARSVTLNDTNAA